MIEERYLHKKEGKREIRKATDGTSWHKRDVRADRFAPETRGDKLKKGSTKRK
ncbi:MAG: hypothetical protein WC919_08225 [Candidatus Paceibacterota bacterium]|jgi:hypothetical protein